MSETDKQLKRKGFTLDWLVGGVLTKVGDTFDRVTGRGWNPSSSLATSKLVEKLKFLLDAEARESESKALFVPHILALKIQWNKFSQDAEGELEKLSNELHAAAINHINDRLYHTYAPIKIDVKTDYFTEGVRLTGSFGEFGEEDEDEAAVNVTLPNIKVTATKDGTRMSINLEGEAPVISEKPIYTLSFTVNGKTHEKVLDFSKSKRFSVGRVKENEVTIDHTSVSKVHASLVLNADENLLLADTGSTNGTYVDGTRIAYGKAIEVRSGTSLKFGTVQTDLAAKFIPAPAASAEETEILSIQDKTAADLPQPVSVPPDQLVAERPPDRTVTDIDPGSSLPNEVSVENFDTGKSSDWGDFSSIPEESPPPTASVKQEIASEDNKSGDWAEFGVEEEPEVEEEPVEAAKPIEERSKEDWEI